MQQISPMTPKFLSAIILISLHLFLSTKLLSQDTVEIQDKPRSKMNYDKPGHYELVIQLENAEMEPGDTLKIGLYFSGYGQIRGSKVFFSTAKNIFTSDSYIKHNLGKNVTSPLYWGYDSVQIKDPDRFSFALGGISSKMRSEEWETSTPYIDFITRNSVTRDSSNFLILTEMALRNKPVSIYLVTPKNVPDGSYSAVLVYTYFNGQEWAGSSQTINFRIKNVLERNPKWVFGLLVIGAITILPILFQLSLWFWKLLFNRKKKDSPIVLDASTAPAQPPIKKNKA